MTIKTQPFEDVSPMKHGDFSLPCEFSKELPFFSIISLNRVPADRPRPEATRLGQGGTRLGCGGLRLLVCEVGLIFMCKVEQFGVPNSWCFPRDTVSEV